MNSKIILGSANFQNNYGIAKKSFNNQNFKKILKVAAENDIKEIDTAFSYSADNKIRYFSKNKWKINTKIPSLNLNENIKKNIFKMVEKSLNYYKLDSFESVLLHNPAQILTSSGDKIINSLIHLKKKGLTKKIGYSVYYPEELRKLIKYFSPDLVQVPISIADKRFKNNKILKELKKNNIKIYARSIFLQGLLLLDKKRRPKYFKKWKNELSNWDNYIQKTNYDPVKVCIDFIDQIREIDKIIIGFNTVNQLEHIIKKFKEKKTLKFFNFRSVDNNFLVPTNWSL